MITKTQISPWSENFYSDFQSQLKQTLIERSPQVKIQQKLVQISKKFVSDSRIPKTYFRKHRPSQSDIKKHKSVSLSKNLEQSGSNPQIHLIKHQRRLSSYLPTQQKQSQIKEISQRGRKFLSIPVLSKQKTSQQKKAFFDNENSRLLENQMYLFSLCKKQQIRWQCHKESEQQKLEREQIFKKVDQISRKRKKQIKLPRISVAYSTQKILN